MKDDILRLAETAQGVDPFARPITAARITKTKGRGEKPLNAVAKGI